MSTGAQTVEAPTAERTRSFGGIVPIVALAAGFCVLAYAAIGILMALTDHGFRYFTRDVAATFEANAAVGMLTYVGVLVVWTASIVCLLAAVHLSRTGVASVTPLVLAGMGIAYLVVDDLFQFHELVFPELGIPQKVVFAVYGALALGYVWRYRTFLRAHEWPLLALGAVALAASVTVDQLADVVLGEVPRNFVEDWFKLFGYSLLAAYFVRLALRLLADAYSSTPGIE